VRLSVIIPTLNEADRVARAIRSAAGADEVIVVDGASTDETCAVAAALGARIVECASGRGRQIARGTEVASGDVFLFLHADTQLPDGFREEVMQLVESNGVAWGRFDVRFDTGGRLLRLIARLISLRSRVSRIATGDQAIFVTRTAFRAVGGIREPELFEDIDLTRRLRRHGRMGIPRRHVVTSSRRWLEAGTLQTTLRMWLLRALYLAGVPSRRLAQHYRHVR
jgi:rSAM/selenodomain-associated transferase 2